MENDINAILIQIENLQKDGYEDWSHGRRVQALDAWLKAWELVAGLMETGRFSTLEALDEHYHGSQSITLWATDISEALCLAGQRRSERLPDCIRLNRQVLAWSSDQHSLNSKNRCRMIADGLFETEGPETGDAAYRDFLAQDPRWSWGWASWAEQYGFGTRRPWHDLKKAESILREALQVEGQDNRIVILERLREILEKQGKNTEASTVETSPQVRSVWKKIFDKIKG